MMWPSTRQSTSTVLDVHRARMKGANVIKRQLRDRRNEETQASRPLTPKSILSKKSLATFSSVSTSTLPSDLELDNFSLRERRQRATTMIEDIVQRRHYSLSASLVTFQRRVANPDLEKAKIEERRNANFKTGNRDAGSGCEMEAGSSRSISTSTTMDDDDLDNFINNDIHKGQKTRDSAVQTDQVIISPKKKIPTPPKITNTKKMLVKKSKSSSSASVISASSSAPHKRGSVPAYLRRFQHEQAVNAAAAEEARLRVEQESLCPPHHVRLDEDERLRVLDELRAKYDELVVHMNKLPVSSDTRRVRERRKDIDEQLKQTETAIKTYSKPLVFVVTHDKNNDKNNNDNHNDGLP